MSTPVKERPIIFSGPMVRAILANKKSQTRRIKDGLDCIELGDRLWVKETWQTGSKLDKDSPKQIEQRCREAGYLEPACCPLKYVCDGNATTWGDDDRTDFGDWGGLRPSIFMPHWASRLTLEVTGVRAERLQDISEADATAEGIATYLSMEPLGFSIRRKARYHDTAEALGALAGIFATYPKLRGFIPSLIGAGLSLTADGKADACTARAAFAHAWEGINGPRGHGWDANDWVWVYDFRRVA